MHRIIASLLLFCALSLVALQSAIADITIDTVTVGNPGNTSDPSDGDSSTPGIQSFGAVPYSYRIGKTEVTVGQYTVFLNAVAATDTYELYLTQMSTNLNIAGISRSGIAGGYTYNVIGSPNHPVTYVDWGDAARFANWMQNGQPTGLQGPRTTEDGAYTMNGAYLMSGPGSSNQALNAISRNVGAQWFVPTEDEWYKAAYHQPTEQGGDVDNYWLYPTRSNIAPNSDQPPGNLSIQTNVANFFLTDSLANGYNDGYAVTGSTVFNTAQNYLTDAGAYVLSQSYYGTLDQGGNVWEYNETIFSNHLWSRAKRGGGVSSGLNDLKSSTRNQGNQFLTASSIIGFRVSTVPEPTTLALAATACLCGLVAVRLPCVRATRPE